MEYLGVVILVLVVFALIVQEVKKIKLLRGFRKNGY
jgi:hypothetical protein